MYVYFLRAGTKGAIKIGIAEDVEKRIENLQVGNAFKLNVIGLIKCESREEARYKESRFHKFFARQRIRGEWFMGNINFKKLREFDDKEKIEKLFKEKEQEDYDMTLLESSPL